MVAQTRSKSRSSANIGVTVNRHVPETSHKKTMKKARSEEVVNHNVAVADASKKKKKMKKKDPYLNSMDFAFRIFLKDYKEKCSLVNCNLEQLEEAHNCFDALSPKDRQSYEQKYMVMEAEKRKEFEAYLKEHSAHFRPLPKGFRCFTLHTFHKYLKSQY